ncbi:MAG: S9 family peptidase [Flavitalea sp.]
MHSKMFITEGGSGSFVPEAHPFSYDDLHKVTNIGSPKLSPDGKKIVAVISKADISANEFSDTLVLIDIATGSITDLAEGGSPAWSPDGGQIAFEQWEDDHSVIYLFNPATMKKKFLVAVHHSNYFMGHLVEKGFAWSPDGKYIAYAGAFHTIPENTGGARVVNRLNYKTKGGRGRPSFTDDQFTHLWLIDVSGNDPILLTSGNYNEHSFSWSPDSLNIAFISNRTEDFDKNHNSDLWTVNVNTKEITRLTEGPGTRSCARWAPDGKHIAYLGVTSLVTSTDSVADDTQVFVTGADGKYNRCVSKTLNRRTENIQWAPDASGVYFTAGNEGSTNLYKASLSGEIKTIIEEQCCIREYFVGASHHDIAVVKTSITKPVELFLYSPEQGSAKQLTQLNTFINNHCILSDAEAFWYPSFDEEMVQGWILKPYGFKEGGKYPLTLVIHGGPHNMFGYEFEERTQILASEGFGVVFINPRGSHGYGQMFSRGNVLNWGGNDYKDLMTGIDHVIAAYNWIDPSRLGVTGQSYGGYMTNWIITQTARFRAAIVDGGLSNLISFAGTSLYYLLMEAEFNGKPYDNYPLLWQWSPLRNVRNVVTPTLFLHGETDNEVPISQSEEMYYALKDIGVETTFARYIGEGHGWRPDLTPANRKDLLQRMINWLKTYCK